MMLKELFYDLLRKYAVDKNYAVQCWVEIEFEYTSAQRHYHNLTHLKKMFSELETVKHLIVDVESVQFSIFYHDVIYNAGKGNNEKQSARFFKQQISKTNFTKLEKVSNQILATKNHLRSEDSDINYFLDIDMSILGQDWNVYAAYKNAVRKEHGIYPNFLYKQGRKKLLTKWLAEDSIFITDHFKNKYEAQAKINIQKELLLL